MSNDFYQFLAGYGVRNHRNRKRQHDYLVMFLWCLKAKTLSMETSVSKHVVYMSRNYPGTLFAKAKNHLTSGVRALSRLAPKSLHSTSPT